MAPTTLTPEMAEALRRASSKPDLFSGDFDEKLDARVYVPLVVLGLLTRETRPYPADDRYEIVHFETTDAGKWRPIGTVTTQDHHALVAAHMLKLRGTCLDGQPLTEPAPTICAGGWHLAEVRAFLVKYYQGGAPGASLRDPAPTVTTHDRFGLVTVAGVDYQIVDIGMRMLAARELFRANAFPDEYVIDPVVDGAPLTKTAQIRMCGNCVPPVMSEALVRANVGLVATVAA